MEKIRIGVLCAACAVAFAPAARAAVVAVSPADGETVVLLPEGQKTVLAVDGVQERYKVLKGTHWHSRHSPWRKSLPLELKWKTDAGEKGPWRVRIASGDSFDGARCFWLREDAAKAETNGNEVVWTHSLERANLDIGATYKWDVAAGVKGKKDPETSAPATFSTEDLPPRWIKIEGRVSNIRDLGGWKTADGRRVRTGLAYRGQGLNDNSVSTFETGRSRLMVADVEYMTRELGIKTDLDLRSRSEIATMEESPLGSGVKFEWISAPAYGGIFRDSGKATMRKEFAVFADRANYPVYFHCIGGADRTGSLAYVLNGLLGVPKEDLERDWESTFYPRIPGAKDPTAWQGSHYFDEGFAKYGAPDAPLQERIRLYLLDCGVTQEEIDSFKAIMLGNVVK